jgi:hypothetical protein
MTWAAGGFSGRSRSAVRGIGGGDTPWRFAGRRFVVLALIAAAVSVVGATRSEAQGSSNTTFTVTQTTSGSATVIVPGNGPLANALQQALSGPNGSLVGNALAQVLGSGAVTQVVTQSVTIVHTIGPAPPIPIGSGPGIFNAAFVRIGPINCTAPPPAGSCDFTGYQQFVVVAGTDNFNANLNFDIATKVMLGGGSTGLISGDLYTTFQTAILDDDFRFIDTLLGRGRDAGPAPNLFSPTPMGFAPSNQIETPQIDEALAYAKAPMVVKAPRTAPLGGGWSAWIKGDGGRVRVGGDANNFGFGYRTASGEGGVEYATGPWLMGGAFGVGRTNVNQDVTSDSGAIDTVQLGGYGAYRPGSYVLSGAMTYAHHTIDATRLSMLPAPATSSFGADSFGTGLELSTKYPLSGGTIEPMAGLVYNALWTNGFTETGGAFLNLTGNSASVAALKGYVGARAFTTYDVNRMQVTPEVRARLLYDFLDDPRAYSASFVADPTRTSFPVTGIRPNRTSERLGASLNARVAPLWLAFVSYDAELRGSDVGHFFSGGVKVNW